MHIRISTDHPYSDPEKAARKLLEIANATEPGDGKIYIEKKRADALPGARQPSRVQGRP